MSDEMINLFPYSSIFFLLTSHCSLTTFWSCIPLSIFLHLSSLCNYHYPAAVHLRNPSFSLSFSHTPCFFHCHPITVLSSYLSFSLTVFLPVTEQCLSLSFPNWHIHWFLAFVFLLSHTSCFSPNPITQSNYSVSDSGKSRRWEHSSQIPANAYRFQTARVSVIDLYLIYLLLHPLLLSEWKDRSIRILSFFYPSLLFTPICSIIFSGTYRLRRNNVESA